MLVVEGLQAGYRGLDVLHDVSLAVPQRSVAALVGANGAGKSTLLRAISGRIPTRAGSILIDGTDLTHAKPQTRARAGLCHIAQGGGLFRTLTVIENLRLFGAARSETVDLVLSVLPRLADLLDRTAGTLSGGEQQMVALSRAWATEARFVLVDELSLGLAEELLDELIPVVAGLKERGTSVVLVEQHVDRAVGIADEVVLMQHGAVIHVGPSDSVDQALIERCLLGAHEQVRE